ncbi:hypothetical protein SBRCBS47491_003185 [Sporothrix bragantina]|uniref:Uncharacterized protein n=1 Tax=Sporothrix bragantina TaxID=671064 RepID=A0ABP0BE25_9PEZI
MHIPWFFARDNTVCPAGTQYYTCAASNYKGCCSVDACDLDNGCPDASSTTTAVTTTTAKPTTSSSKSTSTTSPTSSSTSASSTSSSPNRSTAATMSPSATSPSTSTTSASDTTGTPSSTAVASGNDTEGTTKHKLSGGAIGGIVTAGVIAFVILFCIVLWKMRRRSKELEAQAAVISAPGAAGEASMAAGGGGHPGPPPTVPSPGFPQTTPSPGLTLQGSPALDEKVAGSVSQRESLLLNDVNKLNDINNAHNANHLGISNYNMAHAKVAEMQGTPASATIPLFGEAPAGDTEGAISRWGLHGARLAAQRRSQMHGSVRSNDNVDYGGSYLGPGAEPGNSPPPPQAQPPVRVAELDGQRSPARAELETPLPTPVPTPLSTPGMGSYSPSLTGTGIMGSGGRSTVVSSWRDSSRTVASMSDSNIIAEEPISELGTGTITTPELHGTSRMPSTGHVPPDPASLPSFLQPPGPPPQPQPNSPTRSGSMAETPRATLDISQAERRRGENVTSWGSFNPGG